MRRAAIGFTADREHRFACMVSQQIDGCAIVAGLRSIELRIQRRAQRP